MNNEPCWIIWFVWEEWGETASREVWVSQADFPNVSEAVASAEAANFGIFDHVDVRRVEDSVTCEEVEW